MSAPSLSRARLYLVFAAVLWSSGSIFIRLLKEPEIIGPSAPELTSIQIAFFRALFAGLLMLPLVRLSRISFRPAMVGMVTCFALMSGLYLTALDQGAAANAIFLQFTAPFWVYIIGVHVLGDRADSRGTQAIILGFFGALTIVVGGWPFSLPAARQVQEIQLLLMGLGSGVCYAGVVLFLRALSQSDTAWLVLLNHLGSAAVIAVGVGIANGFDAWIDWLTLPNSRQLAFLALYGVVQMAIPYWLFSRGLRTVTSQEAALITLLEPILNPIWAYIITPERDTPTYPMLIGGALILSALIWRYLPAVRPKPI